MKALPKVSVPETMADLRSILPGFAKIRETVLEMELKEHIQRFNIVLECQLGFRADYSCETALL